jgi:hypothetical protein
VGRKEKTFDLRIERKKPAKAYQKKLGTTVDMTADAARTKALDLITRHRKGLPLDEVEAPADSVMTIDAVWDRFEIDLTARGKPKNTIRTFKSALARLSPGVRSMPLAALAEDKSIMLAEWRRIKDKGHAVAAQQTAGVTTILHNCAKDSKGGKLLPDESPCRGIKMEDLSKEQPAMLSAELPDWYRCVRALPEAVHQEAHIFGLLSGLRPTEVLNLEWKNLDVKARVFKQTKVKTGLYNMPLSKPMLRCLWRARRAGRKTFSENAKTWVFPSGKGRLRVPSKRGLPAHMYGHALRRTYGSLATSEVGISDSATDALLGHKPPKRSFRPYQQKRVMAPAMAEAQERISAYLVRCMCPPLGASLC